MVQNLIENLKKFNRKERYHLLRTVTGGPFALCDQFRADLENTLDLRIPDAVPFVAMDYHLDWLWASLVMDSLGDGKHDLSKHGSYGITASQQDVDLLIAFPSLEEPEKVVLILVEAKGDTSWTNEQFTSKACRLANMFNDKLVPRSCLRPHFVIVSPKPPVNLDVSGAPDWFFKSKEKGSCDAIPYIELKMPEGLKPTRCDATEGADRKPKYQNWIIEKK